jgi:UDP-N-acetylmuramate--alanine ligase
VSELNKIKKIYFIGIGGIGMSALARYFKQKGCEVSGYDRTQTALTLQLEASGISIHYEDNIELIPKDADAVVYTPAIPANQAELMYYQDNRYLVVKRSDVLRWITEASFNICIAGTHGKTTISTMIAHILRHSGYGCNAFLGGISTNYQSNFWSSDNNVVVVEADEYDRSFLKLVPDIAVITAMDADHLDIYGTEKEVEDSFIQFSDKIKTNGVLISKYGLKRKREFNASKQFTYSLDNENASVFARNIKVENGHYVFDVQANGWELNNVQLNMGGLHNIENSIAAIAISKLLKINPDKIKAAVCEFKGVKRRFEYWLNNENHILIDDYAHHPEELRALITGVRSLYGTEKITIIFQPHLFSRTRDFAKEFAASLDLADEVILLPIYPAREMPIGGVTSEIILQKMKLDKKNILSKEALILWMQQNKPKIVVMAGAGDIDTILNRIKEILMHN